MMYYHERNGMDDTALAGWVASSLAYLTGTCTDLPWRDATPDSSERTEPMSVTLEEMREHADGGTASCRWPVHCAFCGAGLYQWYLCLRAPMCARCHGKSGPMLAPASWEMAPERVSAAARLAWESWTALAEAFPASSEETAR